MNTLKLVKTKTEKQLIKLIKKNKINVSLEELLIELINIKKNKTACYIINNYEIDYNYQNKLGDDCLSIAVVTGNINILNLLKEQGVNFNKKYRYNKKNNTIISYIRDLDTLKYLEEFFKYEQIKKEIGNVVRSTILSHNIDLLDYIMKKYKINIKRIKYETQNKKYSLLDITEEILQGMRNREYRKKEFALYLNELLDSKKKYKKIKNKAFLILEEIEYENTLIENYYKYLSQYY